jgi:hypothetical protein
MLPVYSGRCADVLDEPTAIYPVDEGSKFHVHFIKVPSLASNPHVFYCANKMSTRYRWDKIRVYHGQVNFEQYPWNMLHTLRWRQHPKILLHVRKAWMKQTNRVHKESGWGERLSFPSLQFVLLHEKSFIFPRDAHSSIKTSIMK